MAGLRRARRYARPVMRGKFNPGWCPICERRTVFVETGSWLRDQYLCVRCRSIPRWRGLIHVLSERYPNWRDLRIHEAAPGGPASDRLRECRHYTASHFFPDVPLGGVRDGIRCENIESLTLPADSLDLFVTQDVLEHVLRPDLALSEIARVLRPGGAHVFTVPVFWGRSTLVRAEPGEDGPRLLMEADYHGDPVSDKGSLVIREWGDDFVQFAQQHGGPTEVVRLKDRHLGLDGEFLQVFVTTAHARMASGSQNESAAGDPDRGWGW